LNIKVSQGSVATRLRGDGILNNQCVTQSLPSLNVKEFWKSVNVCRSYGQESKWVFFSEHMQCSVMQIADLYSSYLSNVFYICTSTYKQLENVSFVILTVLASSLHT